MLPIQNLQSFQISLCAILILCLNLIFSQKLHAQDPILFEHTWYLEKVFDGEDEHFMSDYSFATGKTNFFEKDPFFSVFLCDIHWFTSNIEFLPNNEFGFTLSYIEYCPFPYQCNEEINNYEEFGFILNKFFSVFYETFENINNPFSYTFTQTGNEAHLIIENADGKKAYYNSYPLSIQGAQEQKFIVYPNPVQETLFINHLNSSESYSAKVYNLNGNKLLHFNLDGIQSEINVQNLKQGIYFLIIESDTGVKFTHKIIKK